MKPMKYWMGYCSNYERTSNYLQGLLTQGKAPIYRKNAYF